MEKKKSDAGDWAFIIGMCSLVAAYLVYENQVEVMAWVTTTQTFLAERWGLILLIITLVTVAVVLLGEKGSGGSFNADTTKAQDAKQVYKPYKTVMGRNGAKEIQ